MSLPLRRGLSMEHTGYLGNSRVILDNHFDAATQADIQHMALNYESEDEVMSRLHARKQRRYAAATTATSSSNSSTASTTKARYSRQDILEQYCITERSMDDGLIGAGDGSGGFFSCLSSHQPSPCTTRGASSILTVCVRTQQKAPSDENLFDLYRRRLPPPPRALTHQYAHYTHQARYPWGPPPDEICHYDKNLHSSYFRQYVPSGDPSRYTWMPSDDESIVRMERPRSILDQSHHQAFLMQREREREYQRQRERAEVARLGGMGVSVVGVGGSGVGTVIMTRPDGIPSPPPPAQMRPKHVSFARSHTLTSFDDAVVCLDMGSTSAPSSSTGVIPPVLPQQQRSTLPSSTQLMNRFSRSQERLIITRPSYEAITRQPEPMTENIIMLEQRKRASMKTQATQTEACLGRKPLPYSQLHLSPRTVHRVKMVSQGAQTNGITINGRKLTKSYSEAGSKFAPLSPLEITAPGSIPDTVTAAKHEPLQRTQSDEPPRSPFLSLSPPPSATLAPPSSGVDQLPTIPSDTSSVTRSEHDSEESESKNEILIDFKPQMPHTQKELLKKPLMKTSSDGDILLDQRRVARRDLDDMLVPELPKVSHSHEFIAMQDDEFDISAYVPFFQNIPIRHEGIYRDLEEHVFSSIDESMESNGGLHMQDSIDDEFHENIVYRGRYRSTMSEPDSNGVQKSRYDDECIVPTSSSFPGRKASPFASTDSLSIDIRDQSEDGIWNESQSTVLQVDSCTENGAALSSSEITSLPLSPSVNVLTPSSRRKHLLMMQHQQRSSIDTEALDEELGDQFQQIPSIISSPRLALEIPSISIKPSADSSTTSKQVHYKTMKKQREGIRKMYPQSLEAHFATPGDAQVPSTSTGPSPVAVVPDLLLARTDSGKTNTDMSESTTTDDYITANSTDSSRKSVSIKSFLVDAYSTTSTVPTTTSSSTPFTTQPPTAADSFDSVASSIYSTIRGDYLDEMVVPSYSPPPILEEASDVTSTSPITKVTISDKVTLIGERPSGKEIKIMHVHASSTRSGRSSPTGSSSSSGSYSLQGSYADVAGLIERERPKKSNGSPRPGTSSGRRSSAGVKSTRAAAMKSRLGASVSEDERSAHYSSSGYYDSPMDEDLTWKSPKHDQRKLKPSPDTDRKRPYTLDVAGPSKSAMRKDDHLYQLTPTDKAKTLPRSKKTTPSSLSPSRGDREGLRMTGDKKRTKTRTRSPMQNHRKQIRQWQRSPQLTKSEDVSPIDDTRVIPAHLLLTSDDSSAGPPLSVTTTTITPQPTHQQLSPRKTKKFRDYNRRKAAQAAAAAAAAATPTTGGISPRSPILAKPRKRAGSIDEKAAANGGSAALLAMRRKSLHARIEFEEPEETLRKERERDVAKRKSPIISPIKHHILSTTTKSPTRGTPLPSVSSIAPTDLQRLKAASAESLRSVSPGSDSVFYSDLSSHAAISSASIATMGEKHVHCLHCGKEVDIVDDVMGKCTGAPQPDIVQPPAGFADSPREKQPPVSGGRLYKKLEKRFRSEERSFADRRIHRYKPDVRAKSEEREKPDTAKSKLRPMARSTDSSVEGLRAVDSSPCVLPADEDEDNDVGIYAIPYIDGDWIYIDDFEEMHTWSSPTSEDDHHRRETRTSIDSTESEHEFKKRFQAVTHRMVHRKSCLEMYKRQASKSFAPESTTGEHESLRKSLEELLKLMLVIWCKENEAIKILTSENNESDKTVVVRRHSGEFGFRIHGSKPVVVSAIEPDTPAESSGLEIGDIVLAVNGVSVLDKSHSEVVKIAHAGSDTLILEVARTCGVLSPASADVHGGAPLYSGYLWKIGGQASGHPTNKWIRRWFSIKADNCLYYYKTDIDKQPVGAMMLNNYDVRQVPDADADAPEKLFRFTICRKGVLPLHLAADSENALIRWIEVIDQAIKDSDLTDTWLEQARRNLTIPPCSIQKPDCFGYLVKLGTQWKSWSRRYCVLKDACLYFYIDAHSKSAFGVACLHGYKVQQSTSGSKKHAFDVIPADTTQKHYYFHTESDMDRKRWLAALEYSIDRWLKVG